MVDSNLHEERDSLRRVASLSTELEDISEVEYRQIRLEKVALVGVWTDADEREAQNSLAELARLAETAGSEVLAAWYQRRDRPDPATFVGSGKASELARQISALGADTLICDGELSPGQLRKLEDITRVKVVDRTWLILDIFAQHARSREGKAQVALAQLQYMVPRLRGWGEALSRQAGGIGTRGPGETKIETDRRRIRTQMAKLRRDIASMATARQVQRARRRHNDVPAVVLVGYTNAGKSSLLRRITGADVLVADELFATLDSTVRQCQTASGREYTLTDTVGFVRHLPHQLVEAFRATLEEAAEADLLVHVVDAADPDPQGQIRAVRTVLQEIDANDVPELVVFNKSDLVSDRLELAHRFPDAVWVSAATGTGIDDLQVAIDEALRLGSRSVELLIPFERGDLVSLLHTHGYVDSTSYDEAGTRIAAEVPLWLAEQLVGFRITDKRIGLESAS